MHSIGIKHGIVQNILGDVHSKNFAVFQRYAHVVGIAGKIIKITIRNKFVNDVDV